MAIKQGEDWGVFNRIIGDEDDPMPMFVRLDIDYLRESSEAALPAVARITLPFDDPEWVNEDLLPRREASETLNGIEDGLIDALNASGAQASLIAVVTVPGLRDFIFAIPGQDLFRPAAESAIEGAPVRLELAFHDAGFYGDFIAPDEIEWNQILNQKVIQNLLQHGADAAKDHPIEHFFVVETDEAAAGLRKELETQGFGFGSLEDGNLMMVCPRPLDLRLINEDTEAAVILAHEFGQRYDGWGSPIVK